MGAADGEQCSIGQKAAQAMSRQNDQTQNMARPAVIIAAIRSGGTFLSHCLSNHPQIFCDRGEPLHHDSVWVSNLHPDRRHLLAAILNQTGYEVSMCKLTYAQAFHPHIWPWLAKRQPAVIWLTRENLIRQAVSVLINRQARRQGGIKRPQHTFQELRPVQVELAPEQVLAKARELRSHDNQARQRLAGFKAVLPLTYNQIIGGEGESAIRLPVRTTTRLCEFLDVRRETLRSDLKRVNPFALRTLLANWRQVTAAVQASEFAACLIDEGVWDEA